jgi:dihydropteroate synthase
MPSPRLLGIVNITSDSFSDGGRFIETAAAIAHADHLLDAGADIIDLGAVASNPDSIRIPVEEEIARLAPVIAHLHARGASVSVDAFRPEVQREALTRGVAFLNDIHGFPHAFMHAEIAASPCRLIVMHSLHGADHITRADIPVPDVVDTIIRFFEERIGVLTRAGIARGRIILDPGMGYFLGADPNASIAALAGIGRMKRTLDLPLLVSVSRKSFLRHITGRPDPAQAGAATLAAEIYAALGGADYIRTHDVAALADALKVLRAASAHAISGVIPTSADIDVPPSDFR